MLKRAQARHGVKLSERVAGHLACVTEVHVQAMAPAGGDLGLRQRDPDAACAALPDVVEQRAPPTPEIQHPPACLDPDLLGDVLTLASLSLLQRQRKIPVVLGAAEVRHLPKTETEDAIDQRISEIKLSAVGHDSFSYALGGADCT